MKWLLKKPSCLALFASCALALPASAQTNTKTYFAELNNTDRKDVSVSTPYSPFGNQTNAERFGDDGSAAVVDASGAIIWRTSEGVYHALPNTQVSKPLFVSNSECIVWRNAYEPVPNLRTNIKISYFRLDSQSGVVRESTVPVDGNIVLDTARVTTTTAPFTLVTANVENLPPVENVNEGKNFFVYRLTYETQVPQLLFATGYNFVFGGDVNISTFIPYFKRVESVAAAADGAYIVKLVSEFYDDTDSVGAWEGDETFYLWVRSDGSVKPLLDSGAPDGETAAQFYLDGEVGILRPVELSNSKFVFEQTYTVTYSFLTFSFTYTRVVDNRLKNYSRSVVLDQITEEDDIILPKVGEVPDLRNFTLKGFDTVFLTKDTTGKVVTVFSLQGDSAIQLFEGTLPNPLGTDLAVFVQNNNEGEESFAIRDENNGGILWLHGDDDGDGTGNDTYSIILDALQAKPLFVTPFELISWNNALSPVLPNGSLPPVAVKHYGRDRNGVSITATEVKVLSDATEPNAIYPGNLRGTQVFSSFPFTQDPALWRLETGEKVSANTLRIRRYQLLNPTITDADGDGIRGGLEEGPFYVIPGTFTYAEAETDAKRRGGRLASIADGAEFIRMQAALNLQRRNSPLPLPLLSLPYPLWIGLKLDGTWQWSDGSSTAFIPSNWAAGEPSATAGRTRGRLTSTQQWEAVNPIQRGAYLLELTATDPEALDTDGDGANDYDELFRLLSNPVESNFGTGPAIPSVAFSNTLVNGSYEGLLTDSRRGPISSMTMSVTKKGGFSGRINGVSGSASLRGTFAVNGSVTSLPVSLGNGVVTTLSMLIAPDPVTGIYRVGGRLEGLNDEPLVFELRRAAYSRVSPTPDAGSYTLVLPKATVPKNGQPNGDGTLTGTIGADGRVKLRGSSSDGMALSWSGSVLEGDFMSFFSMLTKNSGFVGSNLFLRDSAKVDAIYGLANQSDIDGELLVDRKASAGQTAGYNFRSPAYGSVYRPISYAQLPAFDEFTPVPNNSIMGFTDGAFSGQSVVGTWSTKNVITIPKTQTRSLSAQINDKTGGLAGSYRYSDPAQGYAISTASLNGVVLQKSGEVRGFYKAGGTSGQLNITPNLDGSTAPITSISPRSRSIGEEGLVYKVYVTASEPWVVSIPSAAASWVTVDPLAGEGNAELVVTISKTFSIYKRTAELMIGGLSHNIEQDYSRDPYAGIGSVEISPSFRVVPAAGESYLVSISGLTVLDSTQFFSPVDWVTITPPTRITGLSSVAIVTVAPNPGAANGYNPRAANITIAGQPHRVSQQADDPRNPITPTTPTP